MTPDAIRNLQVSLGLPPSGVFDAATSTAMSAAVAKAVKNNPNVQKYGGNNDPTSILTAYQTGDWSGVTDLTGKPFTDAQQKAAVAQAEAALAPAYKAQETYDTAGVKTALAADQQDFNNFQEDQGRQFTKDKDTLDQGAADNGILFSGARVQKNNDLRTNYALAEARKRADETAAITRTARDNQYAYGDESARSLNDMYRLPGANTYNPNVAHGAVTPSSTLASAYDPGAYNFQGTKPVAQQAAVQTRAAALLANKANKLSLSGVGAKF